MVSIILYSMLGEDLLDSRINQAFIYEGVDALLSSRSYNAMDRLANYGRSKNSARFCQSWESPSLGSWLRDSCQHDFVGSESIDAGIFPG
jgi:hypothetical protein